MPVSLNLNLDLLGSLYLPFEPPTTTSSPWNYNSNSAYFISQGSEYYLGKPSSHATTQGLTQTQLNNIHTSINALVTALNDNQTSGNQAEVQQLVGELTVWSNSLTVNESVQLITVNTVINHVRNNQVNDTATLTLTYAWIPPINVAILASIDVDIDWAGSNQDVNTGIKTLHSLTLTANLEKDFIDSILLGLGVIDLPVSLVFLTVASFALSLVDIAANTLINMANDGGRVNFVGVIAHAVHRISSCIEPAPAQGSQPIPTLNLNGLKYPWITTIKDSTIMHNVSANIQNAVITGVYPANALTSEQWDGRVLVGDFQKDAPYSVGLPELSWSLNGAGMLLTSKIEADYDGGTVFALAVMLIGASGQVARIATFVQTDSSANGIQIPSPISYPASYLMPESTDTFGIYPLGQVIGAEFSNTEVYQIPALQLEWVIPEVMVAIQENIVKQAAGTIWSEMPQPSTGYSITWNISTSHYDKGQHPAIGVDSSYGVLQFHEGGSSNIYWDIGSLSGNNITWSSTGHKRGSGDWPTMCFFKNSSDFIEIHSGGSKNLYSETGSLGSSFTWDQSGGTLISDGNHPGMAMNGAGVTAVMFTQGSSDLQYNIGRQTSSDSSAITWNTKEADYATGDHASIVISDAGYVLEVHSNGGDLYYNVGQVNSFNSEIGWFWASPLPLYVEGDHTGLALRSDGLVCLIYDTGDKQYYGLGILDSSVGKMNWVTLNNFYTSGAYGAVTFAPSGSVVETHQESSGAEDQNLYAGVGTINTP